MVKKIQVFDYLTRKMVEVPDSNIEYRVSVYGILVDNNKVLIQQGPTSRNYNFPGGKIEKHEKIAEALIREIEEETGFIVKVGKLFSVKQSFVKFGSRSKGFNSTLVFYNVSKVGGSLIKKKNREGDSTKAMFVPLNQETISKTEEVFKEILVNLVKKFEKKQDRDV